jgi:hypothetical protein
MAETGGSTDMIRIVLMSLSALVLLTLGVLHLVYTFSGPLLTPRDPALRARMEEIHPVITRQTTMWRAWVGFNASHSMGAILFGLVYGYLANVHIEVLMNSPFLLGVGLAMLVGFVILAKLYWFKVPFIGVVISLTCYVAAIVSTWV